jgi:hypothetical protein
MVTTLRVKPTRDSLDSPPAHRGLCGPYQHQSIQIDAGTLELATSGPGWVGASGGESTISRLVTRLCCADATCPPPTAPSQSTASTGLDGLCFPMTHCGVLAGRMERGGRSAMMVAGGGSLSTWKSERPTPNSCTLVGWQRRMTGHLVWPLGPASNLAC